MASSRVKTLIGSGVALAAVLIGFVALQPNTAAARPTVLVYKTPT